MKLTSNSNKKTEIIHEKEVELLNKYGRYPTVQEIAEALGGKKAGFDPLTITNLKRVNSKSISLEGNVSKGTRETTIGELTGGTEENYENDLYTEDKYAALYKLMHLVLSEIEETVLCAKMGLKQFKEPLGYVEIAKLLKLKKDRVRQIEAKAKMKLKEATKNNSILKDD
jgi:DNA-directed RNA polymerase sigma subunit (sigma70/sigma32)